MILKKNLGRQERSSIADQWNGGGGGGGVNGEIFVKTTSITAEMTRAY